LLKVTETLILVGLFAVKLSSKVRFVSLVRVISDPPINVLVEKVGGLPLVVFFQFVDPQMVELPNWIIYNKLLEGSHLAVTFTIVMSSIVDVLVISKL